MKNLRFWIGLLLIGASGVLVQLMYIPELITCVSLFKVLDYVLFIPGVLLIVWSDKGQSLGFPIRILLCLGAFCVSYIVTGLLI